MWLKAVQHPIPGQGSPPIALQSIPDRTDDVPEGVRFADFRIEKSGRSGKTSCRAKHLRKGCAPENTARLRLFLQASA